MYQLTQKTKIMSNLIEAKPAYQKPNSWEKLTKSQVLEAMQNGAVLNKVYCVYSYYDLVFPDGSRHYNIRKGATGGITDRNIDGIVCIKNDKTGISYKFNN